MASHLAAVISAARVLLQLRGRLVDRIPGGPRRSTPIDWDDLEIDNSPLPPSGAFAEVIERHRGPVIHKWRHSPAIYDELMAPYRHGFPLPEGGSRPLRFLEIGVSEGGSQHVWRSYLGSSAVIFGVDIDPTCLELASPEVSEVRIGSQADPDFLRAVVAEMGGIDVVVDDGSHIAEHQRASFETLWPLLSVGGLYIVEDVHTAYWVGFSGGLRRPGTFVEVAKALVDDMHRWYYTETGHPSAMEPGVPGLWSIRFYDSIVALSKRALERPRQIGRGTQLRKDSTSIGLLALGGEQPTP